MLQYYSQFGRALSVVSRSILKEMKPRLKSVEAHFKYEKQSKCTDQISLIVKVNSF